MRTNLPITQREHPFPAGQALVSTTDLQGRILYCNPAFIEVSGYIREELLGQPHNMIRHPDMPGEAFRDMWQTIESGQPWSGLVKNRRKNGDHYWVMANVTPLLDGDRPVGYMSVRTLPDRQQVSEAETLYVRMREAASRGGGGPRLQAGRLAPQGVLARGLGRLQGDGHWRTQALCLLGVAGGWGGAQLMSLWPGQLAATAAAALLAAGVSVGVAALIRRQNQEPLKALLRFANRLAAGDLTGQLPTGQPGLSGRLARALNQLSVNLMAIVGDTRAGVERLRHTSHDLASGNRNLAERTESQASSLEQTSASMAEITETVRHSADTARDVAEVARQAADVTARSTEAVKEVTVTVEAIADASRRIREITQVIDGLALQTNLLALNAAVEAARAGEQGRGFGGGPRDQGPDRGCRSEGRGRLRADPSGLRHDGGGSGGGAAHERAGGGHQRRRLRAAQWHLPDQRGGLAHGSAHAEERGAGRRAVFGLRDGHRPGPGGDRGGGGVPARCGGTGAGPRQRCGQPASGDEGASAGDGLTGRAVASACSTACSAATKPSGSSSIIAWPA